MSEKCQTCLKNPIKREKCQTCFKKYIEKIVDSKIKQNFKYQNTIKILKKKDFTYKILKEIIEKKKHIKLKETENYSEAQITSENLNDFSANFFKTIKKQKNFKIKQKKTTPLNDFTEEELKNYYKEKTQKQKKDPYNKFIKKIENKNPEFLFGIKKFLKKLK